MIKKIKILASLVLVSIATTSHAAPFGLSMGMNIEELGGQKGDPYNFKLKSAPNPHPFFDQYFVQVLPKAGLCWIQAHTRTIDSSEYGKEISLKHKELSERLSKIYGDYVYKDELSPQSIWKEPQDYADSLIKRHRELSSSWSKKNGSLLKDDLTYIALAGHAQKSLTGLKGYLVLDYYFSNIEECTKELEALQDSVF